MKVDAREFDDSFSVELSAETMAEAALIARFGVQSKSTIRCYAYAKKDGLTLTFVGDKKKNSSGALR